MFRENLYLITETQEFNSPPASGLPLSDCYDSNTQNKKKIESRT